MKPFLAIDASAANLKLAVFTPQSNGSLVLSNYKIAPLGQRGLDEADRTGLLKEVLKDVLDNAEIRAKGLDANVCTPSYQSFTKFLSVPAVEGSKVGQIVTYEAQQNVPFPLDEVEWGYQIMGTTEEGDLDVMLMALKRDVIDSLSTVCNDLGVRLSIVDGAPAALRNAFMHNYGELEGCSVLVDIGAKTTNVIFVEGGQFFCRSINFGANSITQEFARESNLDWDQAEEYKKNYAYVHLPNTAEPDDPYQAIAVRTARNVMTRLHQQIEQTRQYYMAQRKGTAPQRIFLAGAGSSMIYTAEFFLEKFQLPVEFFNPFRNIDLGPEVNATELAGVAHTMGELAGLGLRVSSVGLTEFNLLPRREKISRQIEKRSPYIVATVFCAGLLFFVFGAADRGVAGKKKGTAEKLATDLQQHSSGQSKLTAAINEVKSGQSDAEKMERLLQLRFQWIDINKSLQEVFKKVTREVYITSGPDHVFPMTNTIDQVKTEIQPQLITNAVTAIWVESLTTTPPSTVGNMGGPDGGGADSGMGGGYPSMDGGGGGGGYPGMGGGATTTDGAEVGPLPDIDTIYLELKAKNIRPRLRENLNKQFAFMVAEQFRLNDLYEDDVEATKVVGNIPVSKSSDNWFTFTLQLKLAKPIKMQDKEGEAE